MKFHLMRRRPAGLACGGEMAPQRMRAGAVDVDLGGQREADAEVLLTKLADGGSVPGS